MTHTPGEWKIIAIPGEINDAYWIGTEKYHSIAEVRNGADDDEYGGPEREKANARLIAAAPDLSAELKSLLAFVENIPQEYLEATEEQLGEDYNFTDALLAVAKAESAGLTEPLK